MRLVLDVQLSATPSADRDSDQQSAARACRSSGVLALVLGVVRQTRLVGHKGLPGDIGGIDLVVDCIPLVYCLPLASVALLDGSLGRSGSTPIDKGSGVGRIVQDCAGFHR